jgi:hypothetical protein
MFKYPEGEAPNVSNSVDGDTEIVDGIQGIPFIALHHLKAARRNGGGDNVVTEFAEILVCFTHAGAAAHALHIDCKTVLGPWIKFTSAETLEGGAL